MIRPAVVRALPADVRDAVRAWAPGRGAVELVAGLVASARRAPGAPVAVPDALADPAGLGLLYEATLGDDARAAGAHYTPADVAAGLARVLVAGWGGAGTPAVLDPACGAGSLLLAAADALVAAGCPAHEVVGALAGVDVDPTAVAVARAALAWWAERHGVAAAGPVGGGDVVARIEVGDVLIDGLPAGMGPDGFDLVIGNPPFQGQLRRRTGREVGDTAALRARWGDEVVAPYTDTAAVFLVAAVRVLAPGGRAGLVLPLSVLAARDAAGARAAVLRDADLVGLWVAGEAVFGAAVDVCAPVLARRRDPAGEGVVARWRGRAFEPVADGAVPAVPDGDGGAGWAHLALAALGVPEVGYRSAGRLGDVAVAAAGFRDEYYGLDGLVAEAADALVGLADLPDGLAPLVTTGVVDPGRCRWGEVDVRFAKRRFRRPVVDRAALAATGTRAAAWAASTARPKVVVATQTRVGEAAVDERGTWLPGTPAIAVWPDGDDVDLWEIAAVVCSPVGTLAALTQAAGTGRNPDAVRHRAATVLDLPLPVDREAWRAGASALAAGDLDAFAAHMAVAHAVARPEVLTAWWRARLPRSLPPHP